MDTSSDSIRVVGEGDLLELAGIARSTWKNWTREGLVQEPVEGLYSEHDVIEALVVRLVVEAVGLRTAVAAWRPVRDEVLAGLAALQPGERPDRWLVIDAHTWLLALASVSADLLEQLARGMPSPRARVVVTVGPSVAEAKSAFRSRALPVRDLRKDRRRRRPPTETGQEGPGR